MTKVFVSHSTKDRDFVEQEIVSLLNGHGIDTWFSKDNIQTADRWERSILDGLKSCDWFLLAMSPQSMESEWVLDELNWAIDHRPDRIVPVLIGDCAPESFHIRIPRLQHVDLREGKDDEKRKLVAAFGAVATHDAGPVGAAEMQRAAVLESEARQQIEHGVPEAAVRSLQESIALNPDDDTAQYLLGLCYLMVGDRPELAVASLGEALRLNPDNARASFALANIYFHLSQFDLARTAIDKAVTTAPADQEYRKFRETVPRESAEGSLSDVEEKSESQVLETLAEFARRTFQRDQTSPVKLNHWTSHVYPWRWFCKAPLVGSVLFALSGLVAVLAGQGSLLTTDVAIQQSVIWVLIWMGLYYPFVVTRLVEVSYSRLLPVMTVPEDTYRRFFIRQSSHLLGGTSVAKLGANDATSVPLATVWHKNRAHVLFSVLFVLAVLPLQYYCAHDPFRFDLPTLLRYSSYVIEPCALCWVPPFILFGLAFIPPFIDLPQRYFLGMPESVSLKPMGALYLRITLLGSTTLIFFLLQHYVFQTQKNVRVISISYIIIVTVLVSCSLIVSQSMLRMALRRLKQKKLIEYSYALEDSFKAVLKSPTKENLDRIRDRQSFMRELMRLDTAGLTRSDRKIMLLLCAAIVALFIGYIYLVSHERWLFSTRTGNEPSPAVESAQ